MPFYKQVRVSLPEQWICMNKCSYWGGQVRGAGCNPRVYFYLTDCSMSMYRLPFRYKLWSMSRRSTASGSLLAGSSPPYNETRPLRQRLVTSPSVCCCRYRKQFPTHRRPPSGKRRAELLLIDRWVVIPRSVVRVRLLWRCSSDNLHDMHICLKIMLL